MIKSKMSFAVTVLTLSLMLAVGLALLVGMGRPTHIASASGLSDDALTDFEPGSGCYVAQSGTAALDGMVMIAPTVGSNFTDTVLPPNWFTTGSGTVEVAGGLLTVDQDRTGPLPPRFSVGRMLEFAATFTQTNDQHIGFGQFLQSATEPWAIFSTRFDGAQLWARTNDGTVETLTPLGTEYFGAPHVYRVEWGTNSVTYTIDGVGVATHTVQIVDTMRPQIMDSNGVDNVLTVDWLRMSDYAPSPCTYTSRVIDSGLDGSTFTGLSTTLATPTGTSIVFDVITSTDGINWGTWTAVNLDGTFSVGAARYLQYRATLSTSDPLVTPEVQRIRVQGFGPPPTAVTVAAFSAHTTDSMERGLLGLGGLLLLGSVPVIRRRRKMNS